MIDIMDDDELHEVSLRRRRTLVVVVLVGLAGYVTGSVVRLTVVSFLSMAIMVAAWMLLRRAINTLTDLPDEQLDERQLSLRDRAYLTSYRLLGAVVAVLTIATIGWDVFDVTEVSTIVVQAMAGGLLFLMIGLPSCILGWADRSV